MSESLCFGGPSKSGVIKKVQLCKGLSMCVMRLTFGCFSPSAETDKLMTLDRLYLLDSGAQFR